jgi:hypothetical protein
VIAVTEAYALQIAGIAAVAGLVAMTWIWIASRRFDREIERLRQQDAAEHAVSHRTPG